MSKAYNGTEWSFLEAIMLKLGFCEEWVALIMKCVSSVSDKVKVNRNLSGRFLPERGLRQRDPLSPYLFLICAEGFSALLHEAEQNGSLKGVRICH